MKKNYMKPAMRVVELKNKCCILSGSPTKSANNADIGEDIVSDAEYQESGGVIR